MWQKTFEFASAMASIAGPRAAEAAGAGLPRGPQGHLTLRHELGPGTDGQRIDACCNVLCALRTLP